MNILLSSSNVNFSGKIPKAAKVMLPFLIAPCLLSSTLAKPDEFIKTDSIEVVDQVEKTDVMADSLEVVDKGVDTEKFEDFSSLNSEELAEAPEPYVTIAGKKTLVGIVVDVTKNRLYRYDADGSLIDGYQVATGKLGRNGKSITHTGIRIVDHIEHYPYSSARGSKRARSPKDYGPHILYLNVINPKTGEEQGSNGEFIHGNNNVNSIGKYASHGCIRMSNPVIEKLAKEVSKGTLVWIKD